MPATSVKNEEYWVNYALFKHTVEDMLVKKKMTAQGRKYSNQEILTTVASMRRSFETSLPTISAGLSNGMLSAHS